jgi:hypothetical protein
MMKAKHIIVIFFFIVSLTMSFPVQAQSTTTGAPGSWTSSINIQNVGTGAATVVIDFYDTTGAKINSFTIAPIPSSSRVRGHWSLHLIFRGMAVLGNCF